MDYLPLLDGHIKVLNDDIKSRVVLAIVIGFTGISLSIVGYCVHSQLINQMSDLFKAAPGMLSSALSLFTCKDIPVNKERLITYKFLRENFLIINTLSEQDRELVNKQLHDVLQGTLKR